MATLTGKLVSETYKALLKMIDNDILTESEKQISDGYGQGTGIFIDDNGFIRASVFKVTGGSSSQFLKADGSLDSNSYLTAASAAGLFLPIGSTTTVIPEGTNLYFTNARVLSTPLTGFVSTEGTVTAADTVLSAFNKIWWNIENGGGGGGGYVPYTGATQNLNLGTYGLISDYIQFNLAPTSIPTTAGTISWNAADGTADLRIGGGNVTLQVGQEELVRVVNKTGANLLEANYQAVRISGAQGNRLNVALARANNDANSADTIGLVTETINNNQEGFVTAVGLVRNIDTTGDLQEETWADGEMLYLSSTTAGAITNIKPEAPEHGVRLGYVVRAHKTQGQIYVKVDNGYELDELHNVLITDPLDEDVLFYDEANLLWINKNIYSAINATDVGKSLLAILNAEDTTPLTTKPRGIRINVDNTVDALEVGTQGYLPFYDDTDFYIDSPVFTDGTQVIIGADEEFAEGNKLSVVGNLAVDAYHGYYLGSYQILYRYNATGELRFGTNVENDFTTFFANGYERARISASGYLGVGVTNPASMIHAKATTAYPKIIIDNASASGGGMFSAYQNGTETAMFGVSGAWLIDNSSDASIVATRSGQGIQFFTNGSNSEKMGINSDGNVFVGQTPTYVAGATQLIVRGKTGAGFLGVNHYDMSIKGSINTFNSVFQVGTSTFHSVAFIVEDIERARINSGGRMLLGTTTDNTVDKLQIDGSLIATAIKKTGGTSAQFLKADGSVDSTAYGTGSVTSVSATVPTGFAISGSPITTSGTLAITFAAGYSLPTTAKQTEWDTAYSNRITSLTTTGSSGASTLISNVLNIPTYTLAGLGGVPTSRTLTINGTALDLSIDRSWTIAGTISGLTANYVPKSTSGNTLGNSLIYDNGTNIIIGGTSSSTFKLDVIGTARIQNDLTINGFIAGTVNKTLPTGNTFAAQTFNINGSANGWSLVNRNTWNINDDAFTITGFTTYDNRIILNRSSTASIGWTNYQAYIINNGTATQSATGIVSFSSGTGNFQTFTAYKIGATGPQNNTNSYTNYYGIDLSNTPQNNVTNYRGIYIADFTGTTLSRGIELNLSSGTGKWNIFAQGTANNYLAGNLGIGSQSLGGLGGILNIGKTITGATSSRGVYISSFIQSDVTSNAIYFATDANTQAATFTINNITHYRASVASFGAGSTVTTQNGFEVLSSLVGATNNYGFRGSIASGTGRWNLFMDGTAANYLAGTLLVGTTIDGGYKVNISGTLNATALRITGGTSTQYLMADGTTTTITDSFVTAKLLTGLAITGTTVTASDSILIAIGKLQNQLNGLSGSLSYRGTWNASTNTPTITSGVGTNGYFYIVSTAGTTTIDGISSWAVGDWIIFNGTTWQKIATQAVTSVNGFTGAVVLTTSNISEGTSLYFTNARSIASTLTGYSSGSGIITSSDTILSAIQKLNGNIGNLVTGVSSIYGRTGAITAQAGDYTTTLVTEGTNLYYTNARAISAIFTGTSAQFLKANGTTNEIVTDLDANIVGDKDGINRVYTLTNNYLSGSTRVFVNGVRMQLGATNDYIEINSNQIQFSVSLDSGDILVVDYIK